MQDYLIKKCNTGFIIIEHWGENRGLASQVWAFSTLKEAQDYLPTLFKHQKEIKNDRQRTDRTCTN